MTRPPQARRRAAPRRAALAATALLLAGCPRGPATPAAPAEAGPAPVVVALAPVEVHPVERVVPLVGTLVGDEEVVVAARAAGRLVRVVVDTGDRVDWGALVAEVDPSGPTVALELARLEQLRLLARLGLDALPAGDFDPASLPAVEQARLQAENAEARFRRGEQLFTQRPPALSEQDFMDLRTARDVARGAHRVEVLAARALLAEARARGGDILARQLELARTAACAPTREEVAASRRGAVPAGRAGRPRYAVAERLASTGEYVTPGRALARLVADDPVLLRAAVSERFLGQVVPGQRARVSTAAAVGSGAVGRVVRVAPAVDPVGRAFQVEVAVDAPADPPSPGADLRPGGFARGEVVVAEDPAALFVPEDALVVVLGRTRVARVEGGRAVLVDVRAGARRGGLVEVEGPGLAPGAEVVVSGAAALRQGTPVRVTDLATLRGAAPGEPAR